MTKLAADLGLSDVALKKRCLKHRIPVPGCGYWRRLETGQPPRIIPLPDPERDERIEFRVPEPGDRHARDPDPDPAALAIDAASPVLVAARLVNPQPETALAAAELARRPPDDYGAVRTVEPGCFAIRVPPGSAARALRIVDALVRACRARGLGLVPGTGDHAPRNQVGIIIDGATFWPVLDERMRRRPFKPDRAQQARIARSEYVYRPRYGYDPTGELALRIEGAWGLDVRSRWTDGRRGTLEQHLDDAMRGLRLLATRRVDRDREEHDRAERAAAAARRGEELRRQIAAERSAVEQLGAEAAGWRETCLIREYVAAAMQPRTGIPRDKAWQSWALAHADRLDPLLPSPSSILDAAEVRCPDMLTGHPAASSICPVRVDMQKATGRTRCNLGLTPEQRSRHGASPRPMAGTGGAGLLTTPREPWRPAFQLAPASR